MCITILSYGNIILIMYEACGNYNKEWISFPYMSVNSNLRNDCQMKETVGSSVFEHSKTFAKQPEAFGDGAHAGTGAGLPVSRQSKE